MPTFASLNFVPGNTNFVGIPGNTYSNQGPDWPTGSHPGEYSDPRGMCLVLLLAVFWFCLFVFGVSHELFYKLQGTCGDLVHGKCKLCAPWV